MAEHIVDLINPAAGVRAAPAFERSEGGGHAMRNYLVNTDNELVVREGYTRETQVEHRHINSDGQLDESLSQTGPIVVHEKYPRIYVFRLPKGATWVKEHEKLFFTVPPQPGANFRTPRAEVRDIVRTVNPRTGRNVGIQDRGLGILPPDPALDPSAYWVDLSEDAINNTTIYRWSVNTELDGDHLRPDRDRVVPRVFYTTGGNTAPVGVSHPLIFGLTPNAPNSENPIEIVIRTGHFAIRDFQMFIKVDNPNAEDDTFMKTGDSGISLTRDAVYSWEWRGRDRKYHTLSEHISRQFVDKWTWVFGAAGIAVDALYLPDPDELGPEGVGVDEITQDQFERSYLEMSYKWTQGGSEKTSKYRYYLYGHRESNLGGQIAGALTAGLQIGAQGAQIGSAAGPAGTAIGIGAGAAVSSIGIAAALIGAATEGERVRLKTNLNSPLSEGGEGGGFQVGQYVFCHTYSFDKERSVESIPSRTTEFVLHDFENIRQGSRTLQNINFTVKRPIGSKTSLFNWAKWINIYAARTDNPEADDEIAQGLGLDFQLVLQVPLDVSIEGQIAVTTDGASVDWIDEALPETTVYLQSIDHDLPTRTLTNIMSYGSRIWGVDTKDNSIRYSKLGPSGYHYFPNENALVPQHLILDKSESPITAIHPGTSDSMLYVFKSDTLHILRGHGEIRGLHSPQTPIDIDLDASIRKDNIGTVFPRTITSLKDSVLFLGSDRILYELSGMSVRPFTRSIQPHINKYNGDGHPTLTPDNVLAWEYRNCYHLALPNEVIVLDLQMGYWTLFDWQVKDVFWLQGVTNTLYAMIGNDLVKLYSGNTDNGSKINTEWESNPFKLPFEGVVSGVYTYHDGTQNGPLKVSLKMNNGVYQERQFRPARYNEFRQGFFGKGHRAQVKVRDENTNKLRIDRIQVGVE